MDAVTQDIAGLNFWSVGTLQLRRTATGRLLEYSHPLPDGARGNPHATGPFCQFALPQAPRAAGVYALFVSGALKYIGECEDLFARFGSSGYGHISPRNVHHDGQSTNCKLNARVLAAAKRGAATELWFYPTDQRKSVESSLIAKLAPEWNGREPSSLQIHTRTAGPVSPLALREGRGAAAEESRLALAILLSTREAEGASAVVIRAGDLHRAVGGYPGKNHRMPVCCAVMRSFMRTGDCLLYEPPKRNGARLEIEYRLPRELNDTNPLMR